MNVLAWLAIVLTILVVTPFLLVFFVLSLMLLMGMCVVIGTLLLATYVHTLLRRIYHWFKSTAGVR
jgi:hypothetical protein